MLKSSVLYAIADVFNTRDEQRAAYSAVSSVTSVLISELADMYNASAGQVARYIGDHIQHIQENCVGLSIINVWDIARVCEQEDQHNNVGRLCSQPFDSVSQDWVVCMFLGNSGEGLPSYLLYSFSTGEDRIAALATMSNLY